MLATIGKSFKIDAAHYLPDYKGKCAQLHGHTWHIDVELTGEVDETSGMVMDLNELGRIVHLIIDPLDHTILNQTTIPNPTCERLSEYITIGVQLSTPLTIINVNVTVKEGDGGWARV